MRPYLSEMSRQHDSHQQDAQSDQHPAQTRAVPARLEVPKKHRADRRLAYPHRALISGEDSPTPGGVAKGTETDCR